MLNTKGFQLSVSMLVVIILGLALLGIGFSIFFSAYNQTVDIKERVDSQTAQQLNNLLDTGEAVVIPINSKEVDRGDFVDFDLGISNELQETKLFFLFIRFDEYVGVDDGPEITAGLQAREINQASCAGDDQRFCADSWILFSREEDVSRNLESDNFYLDANERYTLPIRISLPRRIEYQLGNTNVVSGLPAGQYIFNVDFFYKGDLGNAFRCDTANSDDCPRYFSRKKIYVRVK